jgi:thiosulfate reductase cytochrome b subunit
VLTNVLAQASGETQAESVLHEVASWWLLICGIIYTAAGLLCIGQIKHSRLRAVHRHQQAIKDLEVYPLFSELHGRRNKIELQIKELCYCGTVHRFMP